jgi:hypothetical protein
MRILLGIALRDGSLVTSPPRTSYIPVAAPQGPRDSGEAASSHRVRHHPYRLGQEWESFWESFWESRFATMPWYVATSSHQVRHHPYRLGQKWESFNRFETTSRGVRDRSDRKRRTELVARVRLTVKRLPQLVPRVRLKRWLACYDMPARAIFPRAFRLSLPFHSWALTSCLPQAYVTIRNRLPL